jgi:uncharacterized protein involved in exopolysaccharide biosynthesis
MDPNMHNSDNPYSSGQLDEVNLREIYNALRSSTRLIITVVTLFTFAGIIYSLWLPKMWTSSTLMKVADSSGASFSNSSSMGGLASIAGLGISNGGSQKGSEAIAIVQSREFFDHLLTFDYVLPSLMAFKSYDSQSKVTTYDTTRYDPVKNVWLTGKPPSWLAYKVFKKRLSIYSDQKSNFVTISISSQSPQFSKTFLELIIRELNALSRSRALEQSRASLDYLYNELSSVGLTDIKLAISQLIEAQLKTQMLARVKVEYSLESLDKPYFPYERSSPQRKKITIFSLILGIFFSTFFVLGRFFLKKNLD